MRIHHIAAYVADIEASAAFYEKYFSARRNGLYHNPVTGLKTYFLTFGGGSEGASLELMTRPGLAGDAEKSMRYGYIHFCLSVGGERAVDDLAERIRAGGYEVLSGPRVTGDGMYECAVKDPDGNIVEITA